MPTHLAIRNPVAAFSLVLLLILAMPATAQSVVTIDANAVTRFNQQAFFPLGVYTNTLTDNDLQRLRDAGFNTVLSYSYASYDIPTVHNYLDRAYANNMKVIFSIKDFYEEEGSFPWYKNETGDQLATTYVNAVKDKPALLAWYTNDEVPLARIPSLAARYKLVHNLDANHPVYGVTNLSADAGRFAGTTDVIGTDTYPIGINQHIDSAYSKSNTVVRAFAPGGSVWSVSQAFNWGIYNYGEPIEPTFTQKKTMAYLALIARVKGLILYSYFDNDRGLNGTVAPPDLAAQRWSDMRAIGLEISQVTNLLATGSDIVPVDTTPGVRSRVITQNGVTLLILSNIDSVGKQITYQLPTSGWGSAESLDNVTTWQVEGGRWLVGELAPQESIALILSVSN